MATYQYIAKTGAGEEVTGFMQADNETAVVRTLDERQLFPIQVELQAHASAVSRRRGVRSRDIAVTYGQLADLLQAGVPMLRALSTISRATRNERLRQVLREVRDDIAAGDSLADAVGKHPEAFTPLHGAMIHAGERAGFLEDVLTNLSEFLDRQDELRSKVRGALIYPMILTIFGIVAVVIMLTIFVPRFQKFFAGIDQPAPTRMLFAASTVLVGYWPLVLGVLALLVVGIVALLRSEAGRLAWSRLQLKLPLLGALFRLVGISRFCRILGTMIHNGVPILQALAISKDATGNAMLADNVESAAESVRHGEPLAEPLRTGGLFPDEVLEMISVAEESNQLEKVLVQIADTIDRRTSRQMDQLVRLIEPLILVVIAGVVGLIAVGLLYPIFTMADKLK